MKLTVRNISAPNVPAVEIDVVPDFGRDRWITDKAGAETLVKAWANSPTEDPDGQGLSDIVRRYAYVEEARAFITALHIDGDIVIGTWTTSGDEFWLIDAPFDLEYEDPEVTR